MTDPLYRHRGSIGRWLGREILFPRWVILALWCFAIYGVVEIWMGVL